jgi:glycosyltransferase involved in cell wall biosynthesis
MAADKLNILLDMRLALEGFSGIPQEARLLFRNFRMAGQFQVEGLLQTYDQPLSDGLSGGSEAGAEQQEYAAARRLERCANVIISFSGQRRPLMERPFDAVGEFLNLRLKAIQASLDRAPIRLTRFESRFFEDFTWRSLFSKTLPAADFPLVAGADYRVCSMPWKTLQDIGAYSLKWSATPRFPIIDTAGFDVFIGQTPFPGRVAKSTKLVIRYHDAIPVFMPQHITDKAVHQASHFNALMGNIESGAWFACVSESSRQELLRLFPEAADRAVTIHNMLSPHYFMEDSRFDRALSVIETCANLDEPLNGLAREPFRYLLVVSTVEPRKNHSRLLAAWETIKSETDPHLKLVVVGGLGWENDEVIRRFQRWQAQGEVFMLQGVPASGLRVLYRNAAATVCPSLAEGFDYSGVESMRSGGITIASDIPVHREIYDDAAMYFDPYSTAGAVAALNEVLYESGCEQIQARLRDQGQHVSARYLPEKLLPEWLAFLTRITGRVSV